MKTRLALAIFVAVALGRASADVFSVDVRIVDRSGAPVTDVQPKEITLRIDGAQRSISAAEFVGPTAPEKRTFILAIDLASFRSPFDPAAREAARRVVDQLDPADDLGLVAFPGDVSVAPSRDRQAVKAALARMTGAATEVAPADRAGQSMTGIDRAIEFASAVRGRKALVIVSAGIFAAKDADGNARLTADLARIARAAETANITIYTAFMNVAFLQKYGATVAGITLKEDLEAVSRGLYFMSRDSGGTFFQFETYPGPFAERLVRDARSYYRVSFTPDERDRNGAAHKLEVFLDLAATARYRTMITIPR